MHVLPESPSRCTFQRARKVTGQYRFPLLLIFGFNGGGNAKVEDADCLENYGMQCILFRPGTGENCRVHFGYDTHRRVCIRHGEFGDM